MKAMGMALAIMAIILVTQFNSIYQAGLISDGRPVLDRRRAAGSPHHGQTFRDHHVERRCDYAGRYRREQQHRVSLTPITCCVAGVSTAIRRDPSDLRRSPSPGAADNRDHDHRADADGSGCQYRPDRPKRVSVGAPSSQWWTQLASSVAGGLAFATILTLLLTPSLLMIQANVSKRLSERREMNAERALSALIRPFCAAGASNFSASGI